LPFANLETATGERKAHGISGSMLAGSDAGTVADAPKKRPRQGVGGAPARRGPATPRAPKATRPAIEPTYLSRERLDQMRAELTELKEVRRPEIVTRIKAARELGDLRENADYEAARNEQSFNEGRIQTLEGLLRTAIELAEDTQAGGEVKVGSTVVVESGVSTYTYRIVAPSEARPGDGRISYLSPIGGAFLGRRAGEEVTVRTPAGDVIYRIVEIS
jgi:transcription elongation factor GreA